MSRESPNDGGEIILYDGVCNLCTRWVLFVIRHDPKGRFLFAPSQSETGKRLIEEKGLSELVTRTVVLLQGDRVRKESDAALEIIRQLEAPWKWFYGFKLVPRVLRNGIYRFIAGNRHRWFGKKPECSVPDPEIASRFLD